MSFQQETLDELVAIERELWSNDADVYRDTYASGAVLIFPDVGRIDRDTAVAAIRKENADGRAWAEVRFDEIEAQWISREAALISYAATARWNYESTASETLCATVYVQVNGTWKVAFHQETSIVSEPGT
jgi:hypothetical protein